MEIAKQRKHKTNKLFLYFNFGLASLKDRQMFFEVILF